VRSLDAPSYRRISVPWLVLELLFLVAVAVLAAVAGLDAPVIVGVMAVSWLVVAAAEWASAQAAGRRHALAYGGSAPGPATPPDDPSWLEPPAERTSLDARSSRDTAITRLPPPAAE
jgi:Tfp pilus assembly protein FimT